MNIEMFVHVMYFGLDGKIIKGFDMTSSELSEEYGVEIKLPGDVTKLFLYLKSEGALPRIDNDMLHIVLMISYPGSIHTRMIVFDPLESYKNLLNHYK